jgi:cyclopropane fatty-acyl-phospholipid synthase-like methyltransferase
MNNQTINTEQGHWILAKMGKKVLRPGGKELTQMLIQNLKINAEDDIVEFAPGLGFTASIALQSNPKTYTGIELNEEAASILRKTIKGTNRTIIVGSAAESTLNDNSYSKVYGEAMLTMQADHRKSEIIKEAHRILKTGGLYGIHELGLQPDNISAEKKAEIQRELAQVIKVNARPLTVSEWCKLMENEGFEVIKTETNPMYLLEPKRMLDDEGFFRTLKIVFNILTHPKERERILAMRKVFKKYQLHLNALSLVAKKK